jgi:deoxyribose-phosphate aldolase
MPAATPLRDIPPSPPVDQVGVAERAARFRTRSIKKDSKLAALKTVLSMIDLTTLEGMDTPSKVQQLCAKAMHPHGAGTGKGAEMDIPPVAAVCVYPPLVGVAKESLRGSKVKVASVATSFPSGLATLKARVAEVKAVVKDGADEVDMVISRGRFLAGEHGYTFDEVATIKDACGKAKLKVILETGELNTLDNVRVASDIAMHAGADFIKTSTGKVQPAATMDVTLVMLQAIRDFHRLTGRRVGMKPAGGISSAKLAIHYLVMVHETLGQPWLTAARFRFGASRLANDVLMQIVKQQTGVYQSLDYFSDSKNSGY